MTGRGILSDGKQKAARRTCTIWPLDYETGPLDGSLEGFSEREGVSPCIHVHLHSTAAWHGVYWVIGGVMSRSRLVLRRRKKTEQTTYAILCLIQLYDIERSIQGYRLVASEGNSYVGRRGHGQFEGISLYTDQTYEMNGKSDKVCLIICIRDFADGWRQAMKTTEPNNQYGYTYSKLQRQTTKIKSSYHQAGASYVASPVVHSDCIYSQSKQKGAQGY